MTEKEKMLKDQKELEKLFKEAEKKHVFEKMKKAYKKVKLEMRKEKDADLLEQLMRSLEDIKKGRIRKMK